MSLYDDIIKQAQGSPKADAEKYVDSLLKKPSPPFKGFTPSLKIPQEFRAAEKKNMQQNAATLEKPKLTAVNVADPFFKGWEQGNLMLADFAFNNPLNPVSGIYKEMKDITGVDAVEAAKAPIYERLNAYQQRIDDAGKLGDGYKTYATIAEGVGMAAPNAIVALTTGGSSLAGTTEGLAANAATQAARGAGGLSGSLRGAAETARQAVIRMPQDPNYITAYAQSFGADYEQAIQSGATEEQAQATATISALINAAIEQKGIQALPSALRGKNSKAITQWVKTMIDEGNEEVLQGVVSNLTAKIGYNPSAPISSTTDPNAVLNLGRAAQEFGMGATVGGILGGGQVLTNQFMPKAPASRATQASVQAAPATVDAPAVAPAATQSAAAPARNAQPAQGGITFAPGSVGALLLPEGMGAASRGSLGGIGRTQATRFEVNDQQGITELPPMSNQVNLNPQATSGGFKSALSNAYTQVVDSLNPIVKFSNATGDNTAMMASNSRNANGTVTYIFDKALVDMNGNRIGESLTDVMSRIPKNNQADFWNYMLQRHNVNRAVVDKNVIANYNSQMSQQYVNDAEARHPEYKQAGDDIVKWIDAFNRAWGVESGVIDAAVYENLRNQYTSYIPTQREFSEVEQALTGGSVGQKFVDNQSPMRTATGSARDINNPVENIMRLVNTTVKTARYNQVGQSLLNTVRANPGMTAQYAEIITPEEAELSRGKNIVSVLEGGKEVYLRINDKSLLESLEGLPKSTKAIPVIPQLTNIYKGLITQKNPFFAVRNFARDLPTGYIYGSENNPLKYLKGEAQAFKDIATNSPEYQRFKAIGGGMSGFFSTEQAKVEKAAVNLLKEKNILQKTAATLEKFNSAIEEATRLNEFNTVYNSTGDVQKALNAANNVTVNFARGGNITKTLDKNGVAYLNASVQGLDRLVKSFRTPKTAIATLMKGGLSITAPTIALFLLNWKNPYYADLTDRTKDAYYLIPNILGERDKAGNAETFIKIPKSREFGVLFGSLFERTMRAVSGDEDAFKGFGNTITTNFAPSNPFENNLFAPAVINLKANKDFAGRTIVPQNLQDRSPYLQYDEKTSELSKFIAGLTKGTSFELSPKQLDYLIDSYSGVIGDFLLPATTKGGNVGKVITNQFTADSVYSSQSMTDFYDNMKKAETAVADQKVVGSAYPEKQTVEEKIVNAYTRASKDISALGKISTRAGAGLLTADDRALLKEFGIDATLDSSDLQRAVREEQIQIAEDADALAGRANEKELDAYNGKATPTAFEKYVGAGLSETQAHALYEAIEAIVPEPGKSSASVQQKVSTILSQNLSGKQTAALVASLYTTRDSDGNVKAESLLPSLNNADRLIQLYSSTGESEFISMTVPAEFSQNKQTYTLTDSEKRVFKDAYIRFFNNRITALSTEKQIKKLRDTAYETAKIAVIKSRN
jgi:hypothetical protein